MLKVNSLTGFGGRRPASAGSSGAAKAATITAPNGTGNTGVTGFGFQPDLLLAIGINNIVGSNTVARLLFGAAKSSSSRACAAMYGRTGVSTTETSHTIRTDYFMSTTAGAGSDASNNIADFTTMDADGFTLNWAQNFNSQAFPCLALKGALSKIGSLDLNTSTGNQAVTGVGFQPKLVILWTSAPNVTEGGAAEGYFSFGAAVSSTKRFTYGYRDRDALGTTDTERYSSSSHIYTEISTGAVTAQADFVSMDADGFTINVETAPGAARRINYLALGGTALSVDVAGNTSKTTTGNQGYTGVGFQPTALILVANDNTVAQLDTIVSGATLGVGFATSSTARGYAACGSSDNAGTSSAGRRTSSSGAIVTVVATGAVTINTEADHVSMDSDGYTLNWTTANATAREFHHIALRIA